MSSADSLKQRLAFIQIDDAAKASLAAQHDNIEAALPLALDQFYRVLRETPEVRRFFSDETQIQGAKSAQIKHWGRILRGQFDADYVASVTRIGETHARIGLEPRWYIGGYTLIIEHLMRVIIASSMKRGIFDKPRDVSDAVSALLKCAMLDMDIVITTYLDAAEKARVESERLAIERSERVVVSSFGEGLSRLDEGDLTYRLAHDLPAAYVKLQQDFNGAVQKLDGALHVIATNASGIRAAAGEVSGASDDLSRRTEQQAASLEETAAALDQVTATVKRTAENAVNAESLVVDARGVAAEGGRVMRVAIEAMGEIEKSSAQIAQIIGVIDEIAFQTNLLALNAGVEAARAGEAGRGFAVVASEVRALAQRAADAAKQIKGLISASGQHVEGGVDLVGQAGQALDAIVQKVNAVSQIVGEIASSAKEQAAGLAEVNAAVNHMDQSTQQNAAMVEETTAASHALAQEAAELTELVAKFSFTESHAPPAARDHAHVVALRR